MKYEKQLPVRDGWDIIVCGAGPSGIAAAVSAARLGMRVLLLERYGVVGGCLTLGNVSTIMGRVSKGSIRDELALLLNSPDAATAIDTEAAKGLLTALLHKENITLRLQTPIVDAYMEAGIIKGVIALTQEGLACFTASRIIDATGDGYVAAMAGAQVMVGRDEDGLVQPSSLMYTIEGIDPKNTLVCNHEEHYTVLSNGKEYLATCEKAAAEGLLPSNITIVRLYKTDTPGERLVNATQANGVNVLTEGDTEKAEVLLRQQIDTVNHFLRSEIPGFEKIRTRVSASTLGVRESRRIRGKYLLSAEDCLVGRRFTDCVVHNADFVIDIHNPTGGGQAETDGCPHKAIPYDIPMRSLQPLDVENLILCGRCISGSHRAHASYRVMNIMMAVGQAAGTMAAVSVKTAIPVSELPYEAVKTALEAQGCTLTD
jgi:Pyruvate/2-oxoglutarate dehydrogenase complex, dihydrolipoamide dehydrogenase (E3) component, and related enzymes